MNHQESFLSPTAIFVLFYDVDVALISLKKESYWIWILSKSSSQCHNNPVLVPLCKPPDPMKDIYDGNTYDLKTRVDIWMRMDVVPVEYVTFAQTFHLTMWFFRFITGITFK